MVAAETLAVEIVNVRTTVVDEVAIVSRSLPGSTKNPNQRTCTNRCSGKVSTGITAHQPLVANVTENIDVISLKSAKVWATTQQRIRVTREEMTPPLMTRINDPASPKHIRLSEMTQTKTILSIARTNDVIAPE